MGDILDGEQRVNIIKMIFIVFQSFHETSIENKYNVSGDKLSISIFNQRAFIWYVGYHINSTCIPLGQNGISYCM